MLDLQPIKDRLAAATQLPNPPYVHLATAKKGDVQLVDNCQADLAALVAEVERLRGAIKAHQEGWGKSWNSDCEATERLWRVLND